MHPRHLRSRTLQLLAALAVAAGLAGSARLLSAQAGPRAPSPAPHEPTLEEVRAATERFRDVEAAVAEGYTRDPMDMCVTAEMEARPAEEGGMGIHYIRPDLLGITGPPDPRVSGTGTYTDFRRPAILIYEPQADGSLELVAVENLVFQRAWEEAGNTEPPSFHGLAYDHMADDPGTAADEAHGFEPHYDRHVWLYRENPLGVFAPFNPTVTCEHHRQEDAHGAGHGSAEEDEPLMTADDFLALPSGPADRRIAYGEDPNQYGELRVPPTAGPHPVAVLVHGGAFTELASAGSFGPMADALKAGGIATWNVEFRRLPQPGSGWPGTFLDVGRAVDHLRSIAPGHDLDLDRVVVVGHSSGAHLATWVAARPRIPAGSALYLPDPLRVRGVVALAGPANLEEALVLYARAGRMSNIAALMGGTPAEVPERYAHASPANLLPLGVPQLLLVGEQDPFTRGVMERYADAARRAGDPVRLTTLPDAGHFEPGSPLARGWPSVRRAIRTLLEKAPGHAARDVT